MLSSTGKQARGQRPPDGGRACAAAAARGIEIRRVVVELAPPEQLATTICERYAVGGDDSTC